MLPKKERLSREAFNRFFSAGKRSHSPLLQIVYTPHPTLHVSVVVPKKIAKLAVTRNKIRRRIYDIVRHYRDDSRVQGVFIFLVKAEIASTPYAVLKQEVRASIESVVNKFR